MRGCPRLSVLASSRERLAIAGESVFRVPSLATPDTDTRLSAATAGECPAIRFFLDRAAAAGDGFALTDDNAPAVAAICRRLDGIPLAIELAVPRLKVLSPQQLGRGLDERFGLLTGGSRTALHPPPDAAGLVGLELRPAERGREIAAATVERVRRRHDARIHGGRGRRRRIGRRAAPRSAVVAGGKVAGRCRAGRRRAALSSARKHALLRPHKSAALAEPDLRRRHARHLVDRLAAATTAWETTATDRWLARYGADIDNLRAALDWAFGPEGDAAIGLELVGSSHIIWAELGLMLEHRRWVEQDFAAAKAPRRKPLPGCCPGRPATSRTSTMQPTTTTRCRPRPSIASSATRFSRGRCCCAPARRGCCPTAPRTVKSLLRDAHALLRAHGADQDLGALPERAGVRPAVRRAT